MVLLLILKVLVGGEVGPSYHPLPCLNPMKSRKNLCMDLPPYPLAKECLLDCLFEGASCLVPWEVDDHKSLFFLLLGLVVLKSTFIVVASLLSLEGRAIV